MESQIKIFQKKAGEFHLPAIGLGTWQMGGGYERDPANDDERDIRAIQDAIQMGVTHIDTAELYANGYVEELIARAIADFDRDRLFIASKVIPAHLSYKDVLAACRRSLSRLKISRIDLYLIHSFNSSILLSETMKALDKLVDDGLVRNIGVSNFDPGQIEQAQSQARHKIVNNQVHYSLSARGNEQAGTLDYCRKNDILVTAYRPVGKGEFARSGNALLDKYAQKYQKTPAQIALNWAISKPGVVTLVKTSNPDHLRENLGALGWTMKKGDIEDLDKNFPFGATMGGSNI